MTDTMKSELVRDLTPEERAQLERETLEVHAEFERRLNPRAFLAYNQDGAVVAIAFYTSDEEAAEVTLRWLKEGRTVKLLPHAEAVNLFKAA